jgi:hypothetical protein
MVISQFRIWLATPETIDRLPAGTRYCILANRLDLGGEFTGKKTILTDSATINGKSLMSIGCVDCVTDVYPNGEPIWYEGAILDWIVQPQEVDPCEGISNKDVLKSATVRGLIR